MKNGKFSIKILFLLFFLRLIVQTVRIIHVYKIFGYGILLEKGEKVLALSIVLLCFILQITKRTSGYILTFAYCIFLVGSSLYYSLQHTERILGSLFPLTILVILNLETSIHEFGIINRKKTIVYSILLSVFLSIIFFLVLYFW